MIFEFDSKATKEARFAYHCDKLECDIQCKLYDEEGCVDLTKQRNNPIFNNKNIQDLLNYKGSWSGSWIELGREKYGCDQNFDEVSKYVENNDIGDSYGVKERAMDRK